MNVYCTMERQKTLWSFKACVIPFSQITCGTVQRMTQRGENSPFIGSIFLVLLGTKVVVILRWSLF